MDRKERRETAHQIEDEVKHNIKNTKKIKVIFSILKLGILIGIVIAIPLYIFFYHHDFIDQFKSFDDIIAFLNMYKTESILIYIAVQILQIVISVIPGQAFQFAAGYLFGFPMGLVYSIIGAVAGTTLTYYLARILGQDAIHIFFGEERIKYFLERLNSKKSYTIVFLIYLIPGLPKDIVSYVAGISHMTFKPFLIISLIGRLPGMAGSLLIGALYFKSHYIAMAVIGIIAIVAFLVCIIKRKKIITFMDKFYDRITE